MSEFTLKDLYLIEVESEKKRLGYIESGQGDLENILSNMNTMNFRFGLYYFSIENNIDKAKNCFYNCARLDEILVNKMNSRFLDWSVDRPCYAILSGNSDIIKRYGKLRFKQNGNFPSMDDMIINSKCAPISSLLFAMSEDYTNLAEDIERIKKNCLTKKKYEYLIPDMLYFEGILAKNSYLIQEALNEMFTKKRISQRNIDPMYHKFIALPQAAYLYFAKMIGFDITIDNDLAANELSKSTNKIYYHDAYDFMSKFA